MPTVMAVWWWLCRNSCFSPFVQQGSRPRPYHFRSGPISGLATIRPESKKSKTKISTERSSSAAQCVKTVFSEISVKTLVKKSVNEITVLKFRPYGRHFLL